MLLVQGQPSEQPRRRLRRKTAVGHLPIDVAGVAIPAQGQPSEEQPRRRLRGKITVGHFAVGVTSIYLSIYPSIHPSFHPVGQFLLIFKFPHRGLPTCFET